MPVPRGPGATTIAPQPRGAAPFQHQTPVPAQFWPFAIAALVAGTAIVSGSLAANSGAMVFPVVALMLLGGLPHGACDISLAASALQCGRRQLVPFVGLYILVALAMAALWWIAPIAALIVFLALSGIHFGEDWTMLPPGLLRAMAGMAIITLPAFGQPEQVAALFVALTGSDAAVMVARWAVAAAPLTVLVTLVGLAETWRLGHRRWVAAQTISYLGLLLLPPLIGFTLYFAGLHAPQHWAGLQRALPRARKITARQEGFWMTGLTLALWLGWLRFAHIASPLGSGAEAFRLLSIVAAPHLALSLAIERRLSKPVPPESARQQVPR